MRGRLRLRDSEVASDRIDSLKDGSKRSSLGHTWNWESAESGGKAIARTEECVSVMY